MQIRYFGYNGFLLQEGATKIAVDPGASLYLLGLGPIIPRAEWPDVTHVVVTHGDPDHYWHADRVVEQAGAHLVCGSELVSVRDGRTYVVSPRARRFHHGTPLSGVVTCRTPSAAGSSVSSTGSGGGSIVVVCTSPVATPARSLVRATKWMSIASGV